MQSAFRRGFVRLIDCKVRGVVVEFKLLGSWLRLRSRFPVVRGSSTYRDAIVFDQQLLQGTATVAKPKGLK
ncbi:hypothetical protein DM860_012501 [Cuscuta australis]|uniref:Uncharacterized protein n=1 Tax=Cuscuta australis TaxID=267555 RepID=A0A328DDP6_9ASTE|nr:hypothetical protein DM860_012501 [Cuscuta australis]